MEISKIFIIKSGVHWKDKETYLVNHWNVRYLRDERVRWEYLKNEIPKCTNLFSKNLAKEIRKETVSQGKKLNISKVVFLITKTIYST